MTPRAYDRYMVVIGAGRHVKLTGFTHAERCAWVFGVLSIAAQSPLRGYLLVGERPAGPAEVAQEAAVSKAQAESAIEKLKQAGMIEHDDDLGAWLVHDWRDFNPDPKRDRTAADRMRRYRLRLQQRNGSVTP